MCIICTGKYSEEKGRNSSGDGHVDCEGCPNLGHIPSDIPKNIKSINCRWCKNLKTIGNIPHLEKLDCVSCPKLEEIASMSNLVRLDCDMCPKLKAVFKFPKLNQLSCFACDSLTSILETPALRYLYCYRCPNLTVPKDEHFKILVTQTPL